MSRIACYRVVYQLFSLAAVVPCLAADLNLRAPAVPLVTHDPYFSIWSPGDRLTDADTIHWTGKQHPLRSLIRIDGQAFRVLGAQPQTLPPLPQTEVRVWPTRTVCSFANTQLKLTLTFLTPVLPTDLDVMARPVTYVTWEVQSADGQSHAVQIYFEAGGELAVNVPTQAVVCERPAIEGLSVLKLGSKDQPILGKRGDDLRIDWGYLYLAATAGQQPQMRISDGVVARQMFASQGKLPTEDLAAEPQTPKDGLRALTVGFDLGPVGAQLVSRQVLVAYDDLFAIKYFRQRLRPYWRRNGMEAADMLQTAAREYTALAQRCREFDEQLLADLTRVGGPKYALLCALSYRQTVAGNKLAADAQGMPLLFPKENFSNGCISTVDVLFPQAPFYLTFSPALTKAMLVPILDYAASPRWKFAYAPHDLGTYPFATGQVYGGGERTDENQMMVEESGNMLIILAALAKSEGRADFSKPYWSLLTKWADYLVANGLDPENQLCSADMFGHLPRNANLALKAIIGIGGYAQLCELVGKPDAAKKYWAVAREYATKWQVLAKDEGHTVLAYGKPGTWGMKHNLIWDRVLGTKLFPDSVGDAEIAWYLKVQQPFGLTCDNRTDTSLIDWAMWSIAPARRDQDFQKLVEPLFRYAHETPSRVPLSDWFVATNAKQRGFQARPVVGGLFIKLLADEAGWRRWATAAAKVAGPWAAAPISGAPQPVVPTAESAAQAWRYTLAQPADGWQGPGFDAANWQEGQAGFGTPGTPGAIVRTEWKTADIWLRREFTWPERSAEHICLRMHYDEDPEVYLNGVLAAKLTGWSTGYDEVELTPAGRAALKPGKNLLAVHAHQTYGGQYIDVGLVDVNPAGTKAAAAALPVRKLFDTPLRDTSICRGPDGTWYLTGTVEPFWAYNAGISLWKSPDLVKWEPLGMVWKYGASPWHEKYLKAKKPLWAPEIHYLKGNFWLTYSIPGWDGTGKTSGSGLLKSTTGKPEGPYVDVQPAERLGDEIDASLFEDDDGSVYFVWHSGKIAKLKPDLSGFAEPMHWLRTATTDPNPKRHSGLCAGIFGPQSFDHVGYEGMFLFKTQGLYYLACSEMIEGRYSCMIATSKTIYGPYSERYEALPHCGHNMFFKDERGRWWATFFGSDAQAPWSERPGILPIEITPAGRVQAK